MTTKPLLESVLRPGVRTIPVPADKATIVGASSGTATVMAAGATGLLCLPMPRRASLER